jgi:hypothetical protein
MLVVRRTVGGRANKNPPPEVAGDGFEKIGLSVYAFNLPSPAMRTMATGRRHAAHFGIEFSLAMKCFISFKRRPHFTEPGRVVNGLFPASSRAGHLLVGCH